MAQVTCSISGLTLKIPHIPMTLSHTVGYKHPIFYLKRKHLISLYKRHCAGTLSPTDSYLLYLALLHETDQVRWRVPTILDPVDPTTISHIEKNLKQLVDVTELTRAITIPSFKQPSFVISLDTCDMRQVPNWIAAWRDNLETFKLGRSYERQQQSLQKVENKLSHLILSGIPKERYAATVASWAAKAADFPKQEAEDWIRTIRFCFNSERMFATSLDTLRTIKDYCECNIPVGSIHFHALMKQLKEGIARHNDYLGLGTLSPLGYTLLPPTSGVGDKQIEAIKAKAPTAMPDRSDYTSDLEYLKAKLAHSVATNSKTSKQPPLQTPEGEI